MRKIDRAHEKTLDRPPGAAHAADVMKQETRNARRNRPAHTAVAAPSSFKVDNQNTPQVARPTWSTSSHL